MLTLAVLAVALGLLGARPVAAQWGGGYGFGGWGVGGNYGYGGWGGMGMTLYDQEAIKSQYYYEGMARYNMMNAQAEQNYQMANLAQQQAIATALQNEQTVQEMSNRKYSIYSQQADPSMAQAQQSIAAANTVPLDALIGADGLPLWPQVAPIGEVHGRRRAAADQMIQQAYQDFSKNGRAAVRTVLDARRLLHDYGQPALNLLGERRETRNRAELLQYLRSLDTAVAQMANPPTPPQDAAANANTEANAPAAGGNDRQPAAGRETPPPPAPGRSR